MQIQINCKTYVLSNILTLWRESTEYNITSNVNCLTISIRAIPSLTFGFVPSRVSSDKKLFVIQSFYDSSLKLISIILNKLLHLVIYWKSLIFGVFGSGADLEIFPIAWPRQTHFLVVLLYKFYRRPVIYSPTLHLI